MKRFYCNNKIKYLKQAVNLLSDLSPLDFIEIWNRIDSLPPSKINNKYEWQNIISKYYRETDGDSPRFELDEGLDLSAMKYYLKLIRDEVKKTK